ncbi:Metallo-dependent phosphatase-like protein [Zychaea mexicana]|uniref:Metallo-dependent phosphatase-like protein n=1 Tax=Zychaea mexicana TaxID=64656 RepID=UPI0022FE3B4A|nr:Metallo-dependent phosphatase-like protein [Zychaea mexicana]KAI9495040.1 Metallo-dependent phosphatase-like protein [Zychaea mexicana]
MLYTLYFILLVGVLSLLSYAPADRQIHYDQIYNDDNGYQDGIGSSSSPSWLTSSQSSLQQIISWSWRFWTGRRHPVFEPPKRHGYFLHITDLHIDEEYIAGSTVDSDCHRLPSGSDSGATAGLLGTPGEKCDAPVELAEKTLDYIAREWRHKIDFVVWTGDNSRHDWDKKYRPRKRKNIYHLNERVTNMMQRAFWPTARDPRHIPLVPTLGNNDVYPHNTIGGPNEDGDLLDYFARLWQTWIPTDQRATFRRGGYFAVNVGPRLRILSLNTMYFYHKNDAVEDCDAFGTPAYEMIQWFEHELLKARAAHVRVYVMGHVPPTTKHYRQSCLQEYVRVASQFPDVLKGHFFGHLNMDHFLLLDARDENEDFRTSSRKNASAVMDEEEDDVHVTRNVNKYVNWLRDMYEAIDPIDHKRASAHRMPVVAVQVAPSVLPVYYPSIRIYRYEIHDDDDRAQCRHRDLKPHGTLLEYDQYFSNTTQWELDLDRDFDEAHLDYQFEYNSKKEYGLEDLTIASYFEFAKRLIDDDEDGNQLWAKYCRNMFVQSLNDRFS